LSACPIRCTIIHAIDDDPPILTPQVSLAGSSALIVDAIRFPPRATLQTVAAYGLFSAFWSSIQYFELLDEYCDYRTAFFGRVGVAWLFIGRTATIAVFFARSVKKAQGAALWTHHQAHFPMFTLAGIP
jgi:hypothetical protein